MLKYVNGDLFAAIKSIKNKIVIAHIVNSIGAWGAGFVVPLGRQYPAAERNYRAKDSYPLGHTDIILAAPNLWIANMIAQEGIGRAKDGIPPIRYDYLRTCMKEVAVSATNIEAQLHCPKFGSGLAGGDWNEVEKIIKEEWANLPVTIYSL